MSGVYSFVFGVHGLKLSKRVTCLLKAFLPWISITLGVKTIFPSLRSFSADRRSTGGLSSSSLIRWSKRSVIAEASECFDMIDR
jgi:hypothetical protein